MPFILDYFIRLIFACWIPHTATIGKNVVFGYGGLGIVIHSDAVIGNNVHIGQHVTIGGNAIKHGVPIIKDNVYIGCGAKILGPITVGFGSIIGANAVVVKDVPDKSIAVGVPANIIKRNINIDNVLYHLNKNNVD